MYQDYLIKKIEKMFGEKVKNIREYILPAGSSEHIKRPEEDEQTVSKEEQRVYRRGGSLFLHLLKF